MMTRILVALLVVVVLLTTACQPGRASAAAGSAVGADSAENAPAETGADPAKVVILVDQTASMTWSQTAPVTVASLKPLIEQLRAVSGELGLGMIRDRSGLGLIRLRIDPAPPVSERRQRTRKAFTDLRNAQEDRRVEALEREQLENWKVDTGERVDRFLSQASALLEKQVEAHCTDIWGAFLRADGFLSEDEPAWPKDYLRAAVLVTDGQHNCGAVVPPALRSNASWLLVHGAGTVGRLDSLKPRRFEAIEAAVRYLIGGR